uniref:UV-stimulated scaffold protein A homolog (inferred by orthology to a C. elegans protein) n=1 Tax=Anisakis simplex TaxID=6269 RepID=A0A0M3J639_ANISI
LEVYQTRLITFAGKEERSKRQCRAPLSDGSLCPRMDKHKCPIHGVIIDRDSMGFPTREQAQQASSKQTQPKEDEEYMRDLEAATGVDCRLENMRKGKRRVTKRREVPASQQVRQRLEKKLLDRRTVKRVSATLDAIRKQRNAQRFQHQFNYALFER